MINKASLGAIGLASSGAAGLGIYYSGAFSSKTISITSLVKKNDYIVVMEKDDKSWDSHELSGDILGIKNPSLSDIKEKCSGLINSGKVSGEKDELYLDFLKFCTRDKTTAEKLKSLGKFILAKDGKDDEWKKRFNKYKLDDNRIRLGSVSAKANDPETSFTSLSQGCNSLSDKSWKETENIFDAISGWCLA
ncbi:hypothetical protein HF1_03120 [Mycoplasma haemofelis str. Langford 1]|uniref:Uncharacterized protein n=1 Tax=Mycoplasma haemofelis (strain Langford 1) TaxID=941640 RepID=E8ZGP9_MYCHL|nr:hypothetical protein [Mycoplasma haemofelis]CBY92320.1 hypothetical protein HF1_03120 [Mycoplasma haemofelis str. Langford 1]